MNNLKEELTDSLSELIEFLSEYKEQHNVKYFIETLKNIIAIIENIENPELPIECIEQIRKMYKSMFFPRDGLSDFYIMDSDYAYMKRRNDQFSWFEIKPSANQNQIKDELGFEQINKLEWAKEISRKDIEVLKIVETPLGIFKNQGVKVKSLEGQDIDNFLNSIEK